MSYDNHPSRSPHDVSLAALSGHRPTSFQEGDDTNGVRIPVDRGSPGDGPADTPADGDPESFARIPSGPPYSTFSKPTKRWIITMVTFSSFVSPMTANIYFPALNPIASSLGVSIGLINLTLTTYIIFQGLSPTIFGDFGDMAGRRPAFIVGFTIYVAANIGLALQNNYAALLVLRMLQSGGSSGTLALGYAVVADITVSAERGKYMGIVSAGINLGAISPVLGGLLSEYLGWRAIFWFCVIFVGAWLIPYILSVPETCRRVVGNGSIPPQGWNMTLIDYFCFRYRPQAGAEPQRPKLRFPNPFHTLAVVFEKDLGLILFYNTTLYLIFIISCATLSTQFKAIYGYSDLVIGLCYLPYGVGCCLASVGQGYLLDWNYRRVARKIGFAIDYRRGDDLTNFPIEQARIQPVYPLVALGVAATAAYGWFLQLEIDVAAPLVLLFVIGVCVMGSFSILNTLLIDLYAEAPATAVAANNFVRCMFGAAATAAIESMLKAMGRGWCFTFWAGVVVISSPILPVLTRWGPGWREERRLRKGRDKEKEVRDKTETGL